MGQNTTECLALGSRPECKRFLRATHSPASCGIESVTMTQGALWRQSGKFTPCRAGLATRLQASLASHPRLRLPTRAGLLPVEPVAALRMSSEMAATPVFGSGNMLIPATAQELL